jgi:hypothetical protein
MRLAPRNIQVPAESLSGRNILRNLAAPGALAYEIAIERRNLPVVIHHFVTLG